MTNTLHFHDGTICLSSDDFLGFLRQRGAQTLHGIISQVCPEYLQFSGSKRILLWSSVRNFLEKMERAGLIKRVRSDPHPVWMAVEGAGKILRPPTVPLKNDCVVVDDDPSSSAAAS